MKSKAWIPCVSGRLSFRQFGESSVPYPTKIEIGRFERDPQKHMVFYQRRNIFDGIGRQKKSEIAFVCIGSYESMGDNLIGEVYWIADSAFLKVVKDAADLVLTELSLSKGTALNFSDSRTSQLSQICADNCWASFAVEIHRTGEVSLEPEGRAKAKIEGFALGKRQRVLDEAFFFIRDVAHSHRHHAPTSDAYIYTRECNGSEESEVKWRAALLSTLNRAALSRRTYHEATSANAIHAKGFLAYADKFKEICTKKYPDHPYFSQFDSRQLIRSLDANIEATSSSIKSKMAWRQLAFGTLIGVMSLAAAVLALLQIVGEDAKAAYEARFVPSSSLVSLAEYILRSPLEAGALVVALMLCIGSYNTLYSLTNALFTRRIKRLSQATSKWWAVGAMAFGGLLMLWLVYKIAI